ncbi:MAG: ribosome silencing factor [Chloroflexi bacterium]|nr:ribosome silencing factor [Chloroflexota bacterium]MCY3938064.1 ribosome silencing factor [Chloroflexota bacterium]
MASIQEPAREVAIQVEPDELAHRLVSFAAEKNASAVTLLDIQKLTTIADYFVICTATSTVQMRAIAEGILSEARDHIGLRGRVEGTPSDGWMALDFKDVLVHLFLPEKREYYKLEEFWAAAPAIVQMV